MIDISKDSREVNKGIVGLGPGPYTVVENFPTDGYDGHLAGVADWQNPDFLKDSGRSKEDWLALAEAMILRWAEFRATVAEL